MVNIVESQLHFSERNMLSIVLVSFAKLKQIEPEDVQYIFDKDTNYLRLFIEYEEGLIQLLYAIKQKNYQLSHYPDKGVSFTKLTDEELERYLPVLLNKSYQFVFLA